MGQAGNLQLLMFDLDGTLYLSGKPIGDNIRAVNSFLAQDGRQAVAVTNNTSVAKQGVIDKLVAMGLAEGAFEVVSPTEVFGEYARARGFSRGYVVGNEILKRDLNALGIAHSDDNPEFVLAAFDTELTYDKLVRACAFVRNGVPFYQTHIDLRCPVSGGFIPDCGVIATLIAQVADCQPLLDFGKPSSTMATYLRKRYRVEPGKAAMVGDRLTTDIALGAELGATTVLVLSGEATEDMARAMKVPPDVIVPTMADFIDLHL